MNRTQTIKLKCRDCEESPKWITLCQIVACPNWPYRLGVSPNSKQFSVRMMKAKRNYPREFQELRELLSDHIKKGPIPFEKDLIDTFFSKNNQDEG